MEYVNQKDDFIFFLLNSLNVNIKYYGAVLINRF